MKKNITKKVLTPQLKSSLYKQFAKHAINRVGFNGLADNSVVFELDQDGEIMGTCVVQVFWGNLHIKYLIVKEKYRGQGIGRTLIEHAFEYGKQEGCKFTFVETMSFQAPEFYEKLGFKIELKRDGYAAQTSFYYLSKDL